MHQLEAVFRTTLKKLSPRELATSALLQIQAPYKDITAVLLGKAAFSFRPAVEASDLNLRKIICVSAGINQPHGKNLNKDARIIEFYGGHPLPNQASLNASKYLLNEVKKLRKQDRLVVFVSGGTSSACESMKYQFRLESLRGFYQILIASGASINEINALRTLISEIKGGGLLRSAQCAETRTFLLSDVLGSDAWVIGSGPTTVPEQKKFELALQKGLKKLLRVRSSCGNNEIFEYLLSELTTKKRASGALELNEKQIAEYAYKISKPPKVKNKIAFLACPQDLAKTASNILREEGLYVESFGPPARGSVYAVAARYAVHIRKALNRGKRMVLVGYGEPVVTLPANASIKGGRARHLAALLSRELSGVKGFTFLSAASDGVDGSEGGCGAIVDGKTYRMVGHNADKLIEAFSSEEFHHRAQSHIESFRTDNNLLDLYLALIEP